jgi:hypothetical protein
MVAEEVFVSEKGVEMMSCRRGEVEVLVDRSTEARYGLFVVCSCREKKETLTQTV